MERTTDLLRKNISRFKGKKWYHQRFDACPYLAWIIAENELKDEVRKRKVAGVHTTRACFFNNDRGDWYLLMDDIEATTQKMLSLAKKDFSLSKNLIKQWKNDDRNFYALCRKIEHLDLAKLSDKQLIKLHNDYYDTASKRFTSSSIIDGFALGSDEIIAKEIEKLLRLKGIESNYLDLFSKLTAPVKQSFINEAEISLLEVAKTASLDSQLKKKIMFDKLKVEDIKDHTEFEKALALHIKKYYWTKNNYVMAYRLDEKHWIDEIKDMFGHGLDIGAHIKKIKDTPRRNKHLKSELFKILKVPKYIKNLLVISEDFTWWQDERKKATYWNAEISTKILNEISKRSGFKLHELKYMSVDEVSSVFNKRPNPKEIDKRIKDCAFIWVNQDYDLVLGKDIDKLRHIMFGDNKNKDIKEFTGLCASPGKITGKVKVCKSSTEVGKMDKGDILVAVMTRPDYIIGMKKASAIVTNEGGITCHAAIVSRELGIPCIIGTKLATEVLKDGDIIEVDANMGVVKIIERQK